MKKTISNVRDRAIIGAMKRVLVPLADGFEDIEAIAAVDILRRGGVEVVTAALGPEPSAVSAHGVRVTTDALLEDVLDGHWDAIVLPYPR